MSLVAAMLVAGTSAFAIDNVKVSGDASIFYATQDGKLGYSGISGNDSLFDKDASAADAAFNLNVTADLVKNDLVSVSAGAGYTVLSTLGLENNLVSNVWGGAHTAEVGTGSNFGDVADLGGAKVKTANWFNEAWVAATAGKSTVKLGRMELDTPLVFTEKWSIEKNTFEAAVLLNQDIPDTTIVAAYVGRGNGTETLGEDATSNVHQLGLAYGPVVNGDGEFATFGTDGAYAAGVINNSWKPLTAQAWYFQVTSLATAYWLQADLNIEGIVAGGQYTSVKLNGANSTGTYALMAGYEMKDTFTAKVAYSQTKDEAGLHGANVATSTGASKLYTEAWWNYGYVTRQDTSAYNVTVETPANGVADLAVYYTNASVDSADNSDLSEVTVTAGKKFGPLDATLAYVYTDAEDQNDGDAYNSIQVYLTLNF